MERDILTTILGLACSGLVAGGGMFALYRNNHKQAMHRVGVIQGYPPRLFPARDSVNTAQLSSLAATQQRLLAIYDQAPPQSNITIWLKLFLHELRAIMDVAYQAMPIMQMYGNSNQLDRVIAEVTTIEAKIAEYSIATLLQPESEVELDTLDARLDVLRLCAKELTAQTLSQMPHTTPEGDMSEPFQQR